MALIKCKECKNDLSTEAKRCPHCGAANGRGAAKVIGAILLVIFAVTIFQNQTSRGPSSSDGSSPTGSPSGNAVPDVRPQRSAAEIKKILGVLRKNVDKMEGVTWYYAHPQHDQVSKKVEVYLGEKDGRYWLRLIVMYEADTWLFIDGVKFLIDDKPVVLKLSYAEVKRDNSDGRVWEWADLTVGPEHYALLNLIAAGKKREMRYEGQQYYRDRTIPDSERKSIAKILDAFKDVGGTVQ